MTASQIVEQLKDSISYLRARARDEKDETQKARLLEELTQAEEKLQNLKFLAE